MRSAPLRFLLILFGLWIGARAAILLPGLRETISPIAPAAAEAMPAAIATAPARVALLAADGNARDAAGLSRPAGKAARDRRILPPVAPPRRHGPGPPPARRTAAAAPRWAALAAPASAPLSAPRMTVASRWSLSGWLLVRRDYGGAGLAPGGTLGGSQAGARLTYAIGGGVSLSARIYVPLRNPDSAELAAGLDWRPSAALPVNLLAERRQRVGRDGRSAFALTLYGGASRTLAPGLRLDLYGQAGIVGLRSRDLFADGSLRVSRRIGPVEIGGGAWAAAQPGAARFDAGPSLSWRLPAPGASLRLQADWRFRVAGAAAPRSGPALTLATDF